MGQVLRKNVGAVSSFSHLLPPHPPYSGPAISMRARLEQCELVTSGVGKTPGLRAFLNKLLFTHFQVLNIIEYIVLSLGFDRHTSQQR